MRNVEIILCLLVIALFGCKREDIESKPIEPFTVNAVLEPNGKYVKVSWVPTSYSGGNVLNYRLIGVDTVYISPSDFDFNSGTYSYILKNIPFNTELNGKVIACDSKGNCAESSFKVRTSAEIKIADNVLENFLIAKGIDKDGKIDGLISKADADKVVNLMLVAFNDELKGLQDLSGIELFPNLETLYIYANNLKYVDLSFNTKLKSLRITDASIDRINLSKNLLLENLDLSGNERLKEIDITKNLKLKRFFFGGCAVTKIDISKNILIEDLGFDLALNDIDLSKNVELKNIGRSSYQTTIENLSYGLGNNTQSGSFNLKKIDFQANKKLEKIYLDGLTRSDNNLLIEVNLSNCLELKELDMMNCSFNTIDLSKNINLELLNLNNSKLTSINLTSNTKLKYVRIEKNSLERINAEKLNELVLLDVSQNNISEIILPKSLKSSLYLNLSKNKVKNLDLANTTSLFGLECEENSIDNIDISRVRDIENFRLYCSKNPNLKTVCVSDVEKAKKASYTYKWRVDSQTEVKKCN
ncbi:leucine-rich repeat domain-containing protein [Spirosoma aerophilum]